MRSTHQTPRSEAVRRLAWAASAAAVAVAIHLLFAAASGMYGPDDRPADIRWPETALSFALRLLLSGIIALVVGAIVATGARRHVRMTSALVTCGYSIIAILLFEQTIHRVDTHLGSRIVGTTLTVGGYTAVSLVFDLLVIATLPMSWVIAGWLSRD